MKSFGSGAFAKWTTRCFLRRRHRRCLGRVAQLTNCPFDVAWNRKSAKTSSRATDIAVPDLSARVKRQSAPLALNLTRLFGVMASTGAGPVEQALVSHLREGPGVKRALRPFPGLWRCRHRPLIGGRAAGAGQQAGRPGTPSPLALGLTPEHAEQVEP
jgi:hypothetical protein